MNGTDLYSQHAPPVTQPTASLHQFTAGKITQWPRHFFTHHQTMIVLAE